MVNELKQPRQAQKYPSRLLKNTYFSNNSSIRVMKYLENFHIQPKDEKLKFFEMLP